MLALATMAPTTHHVRRTGGIECTVATYTSPTFKARTTITIEQHQQSSCRIEADAVVPDGIRVHANQQLKPSFGRAAPIYPSELAALVDRSDGALVIDCRSLAQFNGSHIRGAVNIICSVILKRRILRGNVTVEKLVSPCDYHPSPAPAAGASPKLQQRSAKPTRRPVIIYDDASTDWSSIQASEAMMMLLQVAEADMSVAPYWLHGGFNAFARSHSGLCERTRPSICTAPPMTPCMKPEPMLKLSMPPSEILPFLFLGTEKNSGDLPILESLNISIILNVAKECSNQFDDGRMLYKKCPLEDSSTENIRRVFDEAFEFIDSARRQNRRVLVHCLGGVSRSVAVVIGYLMSRYSMNLDDAYSFVRERRPMIAPNLNFMGQLLELQEELKRQADEILGGASDPFETVQEAQQPPPLPQFAQPVPPPTPFGIPAANASRFAWL
eukprot:Opistho-2@2332